MDAASLNVSTSSSCSCCRAMSRSISCVWEEGVDPPRSGPKHLEGTGSSDARSAPLILCHAPSINGADCPRLVVCDENMRWVCVGARTQSEPGAFLFPHQAWPQAGRRSAALDAASAHRRQKQPHARPPAEFVSVSRRSHQAVCWSHRLAYMLLG